MFQSNAFQSNAFQTSGFGVVPTVVTGAGSQGNARQAYLKWKRERKHRYKKRFPVPKYIKEISNQYREIIDIAPVETLIPIIDPYLVAINREEEIRRLASEFIVDALPPVGRIDFERLFKDALAVEKLHANIKKIKDNNARIIQERLQFQRNLEIQYNDDSDLMMILASV